MGGVKMRKKLESLFRALMVRAMRTEYEAGLQSHRDGRVGESGVERKAYKLFRLGRLKITLRGKRPMLREEAEHKASHPYRKDAPPISGGSFRRDAAQERV
jgi:hypothetical protein